MVHVGNHEQDLIMENHIPKVLTSTGQGIVYIYKGYTSFISSMVGARIISCMLIICKREEEKHRRCQALLNNGDSIMRETEAMHMYKIFSTGTTVYIYIYI